MQAEINQAEQFNVGNGVAQRFSDAPSLEGHLQHWADVRPEAPALFDPSNRKAVGTGALRKLDYWSLNKIVSRVATLFTDQGLNPGDIVLIQLANTVECPITTLAAMRAGLVPCVVPLLWRRHELDVVFRKLPIKAIICQGDHVEHGYGEMMRDLAMEHLSVRFLYGAGEALADGIMPLNEVFDRPAGAELGQPYVRKFEPSPDDPAVVQWGINPEGNPAPLWRSHSELIAAGMAHIAETNISDETKILNPFPLSSLTGLIAMFAPWLISGAAMVQHEPFEEAGFLKDLGEHGITYTALPAPIFKRLYETGALRQMAPGLKLIACVWSAQEAGDKGRHETPMVDPSLPVFDIISVGEFASIIFPRRSMRVPYGLPLGSISIPFEDESGATVLETKLKGAVQKAASDLSSMSGNLLIRGMLVPEAAYALWNGAPKHKEGAEGWLNTALRASIVDGNFSAVTIEVDPKFIYHGGTMFPAEELDEIYASYEGFIDAAVFTIRDPLIGDRIFAAIVPLPGQSPSMSLFKDYLSDQGVAPYKYPEKLVVVSVVPRDDRGRVLRDKILDQL